MIRNGKSIGEIRRNGKVIAEAYRNSKKVWSSGPSLVNWARFGSDGLAINSGSKGGSFYLVGQVGARPPYGAFFNSSSYLNTGVPHSTKGYTLAGWIKASTRNSTATSPLVIEGNNSSAYIRISQETVNLKYLSAEVSLAGTAGTSYQQIDTRKFAGVGEWIHVALSVKFLYEGAWAGQAWCELTVNGKLSLAWYAFADNAVFTNATMKVGGNWEGDIGSARSYNGPLTEADVSAIYESERAIYGHPANMPQDHIMRWAEPNFLLDYKVSSSTNSGSGDSYLAGTSGTVSWLTADGNNYARYQGRHTYSSSQRSSTSSPSCTMGCWVNVPSGATGGREIAHWVSSDNRYEMYISCDPGNGNPYMGAKVNNLWMDAFPSTGRNIRNVWTHLVATVHRNSSGRMEVHLYINGAKADNKAQGSAIPLAGSPMSTLHVGASASNVQWNVNVDDFFIVGDLLDPGQIAALYNAGRIPQ